MESVPERWMYARDPDDAHYVNLALTAEAELIVSRDNDLLTLMDRHSPDGKNFANQFPRLTILTPPAFLKHVAQSSRPSSGETA
jgi:predicted nucleic acid-binding protein